MLKLNNKKIIGVIGIKRQEFINELYKKLKITILNFYDEDYIKDILVSDKITEVLKMVGLKQDILNKKIEHLSESEIVKVKFAYYLIQNNDYIILDEYLDILDNRNKTKFFKIILKLKKYYDKTIIISTSNIDIIYELIDEIIYCNEDIIYDDKYQIYKKNKIDQIPEIIEFAYLVKRKYNIDYKDSINELIKELYRELR